MNNRSHPGALHDTQRIVGSTLVTNPPMTATTSHVRPRRPRCVSPSVGISLAAGLSVSLVLACIAGCKSGGRADGAGGGRGGSAADVRGRYIVAVCDADMNAETLTTRELGSLDPRSKDVLTVVTLPIREPTTPFAQLAVSNSALGPPRCLAMSPDGRFAYVVESRGPAPESSRTLDDLPPGETLTVVDLLNPLAPEIRSSVYVGTEPSAVAVRPQGDLVAIVTRTQGAQLVIARVENGAVVGDPLSWPLLGASNEQSPASSVAWQPAGPDQPGGEALAVTLPELNQVLFYRVQNDRDGELTVAPWGAPVPVGKYPYAGSFTPDGRHFITADLGWGPDVEGFVVGAPPGQLSVIRLGTVEQQQGGTLRPGEAHRVVSTATVGTSPEALAISSDGRLVITANLQTSILPEGDPRLTGGQPRGGSLSLLTLDAASGELSAAGEYPINAMPAGVAFDADNGIVAVTQFRSFDVNAIDGELGFWRVVGGRGRSPRLEPMDLFVGLGKGPHAVTIVR